MGFFSGSGKSKGKFTPGASSFRSLPPPSPPSGRPARQRLHIPVHQAKRHWKHHVPLPYPDVTLPHDWHLDPERIPVPAAPRSARAHAEEVRRRRQQLTPEQRRDPVYAVDSPAWEEWFAFEHEEAKRCGVRDVRHGSVPPPPVVCDDDQEAVLRESEEEERRKAEEEEEEAYQARMAEAMALSAGGNCVVPPLRQPSPVKSEPAPTPIERYSWTGVVREWVSAPPVWVGATPVQEQAYLEHWRQQRLAEERREGEYLEKLEHDAEAGRRETEEEERRAQAAAV